MNILTTLDILADQLEGHCAAEFGESRRRGHRKTREQRQQRRRDWLEHCGFAVTGPTIGVAELLRGHLGRHIPLGENTTLFIPGNLSWEHVGHHDHNRLDFRQPITIQVDWVLDFEASMIGLEDWPDRIEIEIKRKLAVIDQFTCAKDWSSPF